MQTIINFIQENDYEKFLTIDKKVIITDAVIYLKACIYYEAYEIAEYTISLTRLYDIPFNYLMRMAVALNKLDFFILFVDNGARIHYLDDHALKIACCNGNYEIVNTLILMGADPTSNNNYCVIVAASNGYNEIIKLLVKKGADVTANNNHAIHWAHINGHNDTVQLLKSLGANHVFNKFPISKYIETIGGDETKFWVTRKLYDKNNNLINENQFDYEI